MRRISQVANSIQYLVLYAMLFLLPFSKSAIEIGFVLLLLCWVFGLVYSEEKLRSVWLQKRLLPLAIAIIAYLLVCAFSITVSSYPLLSLRGLIGKWLEYLLLFAIALDLGSCPYVVTRSLHILMVSSSLVVVEVITQELFGRGLFLGLPWATYGRVTGPYENPIDLATYLMVIIPILVAYIISLNTMKVSVRNNICVSFAWVLQIMLIVCLAKTEALGAWLGLCLGCISILIWRTRLQLVAILSTILLVVSGLLSFVNRAGHAFTSDIGVMDRWFMWQAAIKMIQDKPIFGLGLNTFMANYLDYWVGGEHTPRYAHNCYLQVGAEAGLVGLIAFVVLLGAIFVYMVIGIRRIYSNRRIVILGFFAGLFAFIAQAAIDTNFYSLRQAALFWMLCGLAVGLVEHETRYTPNLQNISTSIVKLR